MVVLSLFDGIGTGLYCLQQAGIKVDEYYASEIDENAIAIAMFNHGKIKEVGDVNDWRNWGLDLSTVDLLIGGSPCTSFTNAGKREGFEGVSGLFWRYVEILDEIKKVNPNVKFLLENVKMKAEWRNIITEALGVEPVLIDSSVLSAQHRERLYWCNWTIPNIEKADDVLIKDIIEPQVDKKYHLTKKHYDGICRSYKFKYCDINGKSSTLMSCYFKQPPAGPYIKCKSSESGYRRFTPGECEKLMTLPRAYTEVGMYTQVLDDGKRIIDHVKTMSDTARYRALGNGWCADIITHIFKGLPL